MSKPKRKPDLYGKFDELTFTLVQPKTLSKEHESGKLKEGTAAKTKDIC